MKLSSCLLSALLAVLARADIAENDCPDGDQTKRYEQVAGTI